MNDGTFITENSIFPIGSLTKSFTAILTLKFIEKKLLSLDDKINMFLPDYPRGNEISIKHLLTHTSGIFEILRNPLYEEYLYSKKEFNNEEKISFFKHKPLDFEPGSNFSYSNSGYILLGVIIEKISGKSYQQNLEKYILKPLKMDNTGFDYRKVSVNKVTGYSYLSPNKYISVELSNPYLLFSSGAMYSSSNDLLKFYNGIRSNTIITKSHLKQSSTIFKDGYGLGWFVDKVENDTVINHGGNIDGFTSYFAMNSDKDICIILLSNITAMPKERIGLSIFKILTGKKYTIPSAKSEIKLGNDILTSYIGNYKVSDNLILHVTYEENKLFLQFNSETKIRIIPEQENVFFVQGDNMEILFRKNNNTVYEIVVKQGLSTKSGEKVQ